MHKERPSSYAVDGQSETPSDTIEVRQPAAGASSETIAVAQQTAEPQTAAVDDTRNEMKKNMRWSSRTIAHDTDFVLFFRIYLFIYFILYRALSAVP